MAVINLPADNRWGSLGQGIGGILGQVAGAVGQNQIAQGVSQIMQDPNVSEADKGVQALKKFGNPGYQVYQNLVKTQVLQGQLKDALAGAGLKTVQATAEQAKLPGTVAEQQARVNLMGAQEGQTQAATALDKAKVPLVGAQIGAENAATEKTQAETTQTNVATTLGKLKVEATQRALDQQQAMLRDGGTTIDGSLTAMGIAPGSPTGAAAKAAYVGEPDPVKKWDKFMGVIKPMLAAKERADITANAPKPLAPEFQKEAATAAEAATSAQRFADVFVKGGSQELGMAKGANFKKFLESKGLPTGDQNLVEMMNAATQQEASTAVGGGGFGGAWKVALAKQVTPGITESPLAAAEALDQVSDRQIARYQSLLSGATDNQKTQQYKDGIAQWQKVKNTIGMDRQLVTDPTTKQPRAVLYIGGSQVDPKSFEKLVDGATMYKFKDGSSASGANIIASARKVGVAPDTGLATLASQHGGIAGQ
jgi:hypothetical protein